MTVSAGAVYFSASDEPGASARENRSCMMPDARFAPNGHGADSTLIFRLTHDPDSLGALDGDAVGCPTLQHRARVSRLQARSRG